MTEKPHAPPPNEGQEKTLKNLVGGHAAHQTPSKLVDASGRPIGYDAAEAERLRQELKQLQEQRLRMLAEVENTKKRLSREKEEFTKYAAESMVRELLPIVDSLDQALVAVDPSTRPNTEGLAHLVPSTALGARQDSAPAGLRKQSDIEAIIKGVHLIYRQLLGLLEKEGVKRISTVGERFDPHKHEAVARVATEDGKADDTIVEEVQVGYTMHGKVIRPAIVKVAKHTEEKAGD